MSFDEWLNKNVVHTYSGILLSHKKELKTAICDNMDRSWEYHAKWNKLNGKRQEPNYFIHLWDVKQSNKWTKQIYRYSGIVGNRGQRYGGRMKGKGGGKVKYMVIRGD